MKTKHLIVSAIAAIAIIACGGLKVDLAPDANAQEEQPEQKPEPTSCECSGEAGPEGPMGPEGKQGPAGEQGLRGPQGDQGLPGERGDTGLTGEQGPMGPVGPQGPSGERGLAGQDGQTGPQGPRGATGAQGPQGPQGEPGEQGPAISQSNIYVVDDDRTSTAGFLGVFEARARCSDGDVVLNGGCMLGGEIGQDTHLSGSFPAYNGVVNNGWSCRVNKDSGGIISLTARVTCLVQ
jgi:hypothetical protein